METKSVSTSQLFKTYSGTKTVKAAPMGDNEAKLYGAQITEETIHNNIGNDGYLVEYPDGYRSWLPKKVFEEAYRVSETKLDRLKNELADLNARILDAVDSRYNLNRIISHDDRWALVRQLDHMLEYADKLYERIQYLINPPQPVSAEPCQADCKAKEADALTFTDAEACIIEKQTPFISGKFSVAAIKKDQHRRSILQRWL